VQQQAATAVAMPHKVDQVGTMTPQGGQQITNAGGWR
jgi:hypothetical protein